jgi:hypothetical protein
MFYHYAKKVFIALIGVVVFCSSSCRNENGNYTCRCVVTTGTPPNDFTTMSSYEYVDQSFLQAELNCSIQAEIERKLSGKNANVTCGL